MFIMGEPFLVGLRQGDDLLAAITNAFDERSIRKGAFSVIGLLRKAILGCFDPDTHEYTSREFVGHLEIVSCSGNISEKDGASFAHCHLVPANKEFQCVGGHLMPESVIFVAELYGTPVPGPVPVRLFDEARGLYLWPAPPPERQP